MTWEMLLCAIHDNLSISCSRNCHIFVAFVLGLSKILREAACIAFNAWKWSPCTLKTTSKESNLSSTNNFSILPCIRRMLLLNYLAADTSRLLEIQVPVLLRFFFKTLLWPISKLV
ncbi:hypothetical protein TNCT_402191 [Trichonephila clavata]|uniref:Uncharacterized protein n=1 Tax=Trichonephila clavata TaxID=2740835 RepID=A0A8X6LC22_TRICU|nr:hypothetical protein TNCT_402191 [Trichonephila clavata]